MCAEAPSLLSMLRGGGAGEGWDRQTGEARAFALLPAQLLVWRCAPGFISMAPDDETVGPTSYYIAPLLADYSVTNETVFYFDSGESFSVMLSSGLGNGYPQRLWLTRCRTNPRPGSALTVQWERLVLMANASIGGQCAHPDFRSSPCSYMHARSD